MRYKLNAYNIWELGQREKQEDSIFPPLGENKEQDRLFVVCDGMGGHSAGEIASKTVCDAISSYILNNIEDQEGAFTDDDFKNALAAAYNELDTKDNGAEKKMGTTLTFLKLHDQGATIAHIGDSRVYHVRPGNDIEDTEILFQTYDHSLVNDLVKIGEMSPEEAKTSRQKNIITRAMQPNLERRHRADIYHTSDIKPGDYFMLCTDGILEQMEDDNIKFIFSKKSGDDNNKVRMIIGLTEENRDNHSAEIVHITDVIDPIPQTLPPSEIESEHALPSTTEPEDITDPNAKVEQDSDVSENNKKKPFQKIFDNVFKNHKIVSVIIVAVAIIVCILLFFLINNSKKEKDEQVRIEIERKEAEAKMQEDKREYLGYIGEGDKLLSDKQYSLAINKYEIAQTYEDRYRNTDYSGEFDKGSEEKIKNARAAQKLYEAERARLEKERKEKEAAEQARLEKARKEKEAAGQARIEQNVAESSNENIVMQMTETLQNGQDVMTDIPVADNVENMIINDVTMDGYTFKDLGLSVKWADRNVGASSSENYGSYEDIGYEPDGGKTYRLPKREDFKELIEKCTWKWTTQNEVNGYEVTGPNGNTIFLPAAGSMVDDMEQEGGVRAYYMASDGKELNFDSDSYITDVPDKNAVIKLSVRLVCE